VVDQLFGDERVESLTNAGLNELYWALSDRQGSITALVDDATGGLRLHRTYDSFGNIIDETHYGADEYGYSYTVGESDPEYVDLAFAYTGRLLDKATGLQNNLNRWYDASIGRWMSEDPIGFSAGDGNLYRYVGNRPVNYIDPLGLAEGEPGGNQRPGKRPADCPRGTKPINEHEDTKDNAEKIKQNLRKDGFGVGPKTWVGISPEDDVILPTKDGKGYDNVGPWQYYYPSVQQPQTQWWHWLFPFIGPPSAPAPTPVPAQPVPAGSPWVVPMPSLERFLPIDPRDPA
jgi:RHS repeat-associated protein